MLGVVDHRLIEATETIEYNHKIKVVLIVEYLVAVLLGIARLHKSFVGWVVILCREQVNINMIIKKIYGGNDMKSNLKKIIVLLTLMCLLVSSYSACFAITEATINIKTSNVEYKTARDFLLGSAPIRVNNTPLRKSKSDNSTLLAYLSAGDIVFIYNDDTDSVWASVSAKGIRGFVRLVDINLDEMEPARLGLSK